MKRNLTKILYNPSSMITAPAAENPNDSSTQAIAAATLEKIQSLRGEQEYKICHKLLHDIQMNLEIAIQGRERLTLLRLFNVALDPLSEGRFTDSSDLFNNCVKIVSLFKRQAEEFPQNSGQRVREEWVELEKSIVILSTWEGQLEYLSPSLH